MGGITEDEVGGVTIGRNYHTSPSSGQEDAFQHTGKHSSPAESQDEVAHDLAD